MDNCQQACLINNNPFASPVGTSCPIHKLPAELLSYVFELVVNSIMHSKPATNIAKELTGEVYADHWDDPFHKLKVTGSGVLTPWLPICLVCQYWHSIAISTPSLWTDIIIPPRHFQSLPFCCISAQVEQSKDLPIDILIHLGDQGERPDHDYPGGFIPMVCKLLLSQVHRWHSFMLWVANWQIRQMHEVLGTISETHIPVASRLTSFELICCDEIARSEDELGSNLKHFELFGGSAPCLETISLSGADIDWNKSWISSASNLTTLQIWIGWREYCPSWTEFTTIIHGSANLKVLLFALEDYDEIEELNLDPAWVNPNLGRMHNMVPVKLLKLRQLEISLPIVMMVQLLHWCYIPALETLKIKISSSFEHTPEDLDDLITQLVTPLEMTNTSLQVQPLDIQQQSHNLLASVQHLCITGFLYCSAQSVNLLYSNLNQLTSLVLAQTNDTAFIDLLFTPTGQLCDVRLSQLKTLAIQNHHLSCLEVRQICALMWHRKDIGVPLRALVLGEIAGFPDECVSWCQENLEIFYFKLV
ncbi:hypothetical protein HD554DRAFT_2281159 [Boletus coccyginus]|nr:hypothetical protein HD554DRAFT_2281159 [Boletus coccyginus]